MNNDKIRIGYIAYIQKEIEKNQKQIELLDIQIASLDNLANISLKDYGTKESILKRYYEIHPKSFIDRFKSPSQEKLKRFIAKEQKEALRKRKEKYRKRIKELEEAVKNLTKKKEIGTIFPYTNILKTLIAYSAKNAVDPQVCLEEIIKLFRNNMKKGNAASLEAQMQKSIANEFDEHFILLKDSSPEGINFQLKKLFELLQMRSKNRLLKAYIDMIYEEVEYNYVKTHKGEEEINAATREKRKKLSYIKELISDETTKPQEKIEQIIAMLKSMNYEGMALDYFNNVDQEIYENNLPIEEILSKNIPTSELPVIYNAINMMRISSDVSIVSFLKRALEDIISICRYLEMQILPEEFHTAHDILAIRLEILRKAVENSIIPNNNQPQMNYFYDRDFYPHFLRKMENEVGILLPSLSDLFDKIRKGGLVPTIVQSDTEVNICIAKNSDVVVTYAESHGKKLIVNASLLADYNESFAIDNIGEIKRQLLENRNQLNNLYDSVIKSELELSKPLIEQTVLRKTTQ